MKMRNFIFLLLAIELFDELVFGIQVAAWPSIRNELSLSYVQIGVLLTVPTIVSSIVEPFIGVAGDLQDRRRLVLAGGIVFIVALAMVGLGGSFLVLLAAFVCMYPASGAFVSLSQATLMDTEPENREQNMAKWTFAGSVGNVVGPLVLSAFIVAGSSWRGAFLALVIIGSILLLGARRYPRKGRPEADIANKPGMKEGIREAIHALGNRAVVRWLVLLEFSDLMLDVLLGYLALYLVDVVGTTHVVAGVSVALWTGVGLLGDMLLIPLLRRVRGLSYLKISAAIEFTVYPLFLLVPGLELKLVLIAFLGLFNAGWYSILKANLYATLPERSGTAMAVSSLSGLAGSLIPIGLGLVADSAGLGITMWLLLAGPVALLIGLPRRDNTQAKR